MPQYTTPDVYVREKSLLPPSVAEVATAIPAFIGYTVNVTDDKQQSMIQKPYRITSMVEYETLFGGAYLESFELAPKADGSGYKVKDASPAMYFLHQAVSHFFANGGGACYIISVGQAGDSSGPDKEKYYDAIDLLNEVDEVTMISTPETIGMGNAVDHYGVANAALGHSQKRMDRIALVDVLTSDDIDEDAATARQRVSQGLQYGAAYYPYVRTTMARAYDEASVTIEATINASAKELAAGYKYVTYTADPAAAGAISDLGWQDVSAADHTYMSGAMRANKKKTFVTNDDATYYDMAGFAVELKDGALSPTGESMETTVFTGNMTALTLQNPSMDAAGDANYVLSSAAVYNQAKATLNQNYLVLPPSPAIAGIMAKTDANRGVWKAPANVAMAQVLEPMLKIDNDEQGGLNVDPTSGKSINAIRSFVGKGTLVWGARTLAGNDNEWRYISVRRLFNMVEESVQKATAFAVFEPNTPFTWLKIKTMIESYLENLWRQGAFFGETPDQAFFVNVGLGQTMTEDDINNGYLRVEIGLAAVRPAEFIVLTFSHKSLEG